MIEPLAVFTSGSVAVGTGAAKLELPAYEGQARTRSVTVQNISVSDVFIGGNGVLTTNGIRIAANAQMIFDAKAGSLWAIGATGPLEVRVLEGA